MWDEFCLLRFLKGYEVDGELPHYFLSLLSIIFSPPPYPSCFFDRTEQYNTEAIIPLHTSSIDTLGLLRSDSTMDPHLTMTLVVSDVRVKKRSHV